MTALMIKSGLIILQDFKDTLSSCLAAREWQGIDSVVIQMLVFNDLQVNNIILLTCKWLKIRIFSNKINCSSKFDRDLFVSASLGHTC